MTPKTTKIVSIEEMIAIEQAAINAGHSQQTMMEHAGRALADHILWTISDQMLDPTILFLIGPGNNGGDGLVAATFLSQDLSGINIAAYLLKSRDDELLAKAQAADVQIILADEDSQDAYQDLEDWVNDAGIIVDALFGIGTHLPIKGNAATLLKQVQTFIESRSHLQLSLSDPAQPFQVSDKPILIAVDCPSGLNCDTGDLDPLTLKADSTVTFGAAKRGQFIFPGAEAVGRLRIADIGLPSKLKPLNSLKLKLADAALVRSLLPQRPLNAHKGTFGKAMVVAGSANYTGAAYFAGAAAYRIGTGLVSIAAPHPLTLTLASMLPEATWVLMPHELGVLNERGVDILYDHLPGYTALLIGPGLDQDESTARFIQTLFYTETTQAPPKHQIGFRLPDITQSDSEATTPDLELPPLVIDADGLNLLAEIDKWWLRLPKDSILTPHPTEFSRLAGLRTNKYDLSPAQQVQADRINLAIKYAKKWKCIVVLKGAFTVVAQPNGEATIIPFATPALASAGTGDVLAGTITGLLAQGLAPADAAIAGAWLHGFAGKQAEYSYGTNSGILASDVLANLPAALRAAQNATS